MLTLDLAWAAGFMEGEGSFSSHGNNSAVVSAAQVQKQPIDKLQNLFGGYVRRRFTKGFSSKPIWVWTLPARRSIEVMMTLYILMSPKRQSEIVVALNKWKAQKRILRSHKSNICGNGHELTENNVYMVGHYRKCRSCNRQVRRNARARAKARALV